MFNIYSKREQLPEQGPHPNSNLSVLLHVPRPFRPLIIVLWSQKEDRPGGRIQRKENTLAGV